jgi:hypothetical protein
MNGTSVTSMTSLANSGSSWHVVATGDFNRDGKADILWQNDDGLPVIWEMNGRTIVAAGGLPNQGPGWQVKDDGPIPPDQMATLSATAAPAPGILRLSAPDLVAGSETSVLSNPTASNASGTFRPFVGS